MKNMLNREAPSSLSRVRVFIICFIMVSPISKKNRRRMISPKVSRIYNHVAKILLNSFMTFRSILTIYVINK